MGILTRTPKATISTSEDLDRLLRAGTQAAAGPVSADSAYGVSAVWACNNLLGNSVAQLPWNLYRREGDNKSKVKPREHPVARLLSQPNPYQSSFFYRQYMQVSRGVYGKSYGIINRVRGGVPRAIESIHPMKLSKKLDDAGRIYYEYLNREGRQVTLSPKDVLDIPWQEWVDNDGVPVGIGPIQKAREAMAVAIQSERHAGHMFGNGAIPAGILRGPIGGNKEKRDFVRDSWNDTVGGTNKFATAVLDKDWEFLPITMTAKDAQFIESRKMSVEDAARMYGVPSSMINDNERSTFSNVEQQSINYVVNGLIPHLKAIEAELERKLLTDQERDDYVIEFNVDALLRGDFKSRMEGFGLAITNRIMNPNEVRAKINMNSYEGGDAFANPNIEPAQDTGTSDPED